MTLGRHEGTLTRSGYLYPLTGRTQNFPAHHNIAFGLRGDARFRRADGTVDDLIDEIEDSDLDVILSSEEFSHAIHHSFENFSGFVDRLQPVCPRIILIIYLRKQANYLRSNYFERLKSGLCMTFEEYAMRRLDADLCEFPLDYSKLLSAANGLENAETIVRSYDAVREGDAVSDFLEIVGLPTEQFSLDARVNVEEPLAASFRRFFQNRTGRAANNDEQQIIDAIVATLSKRALRVGDATWSAVIRKFEKPNGNIAARFGLAELAEDIASPADSGAVIDHIFTAELLGIVKALAWLPERLGRTDAALAEAQSLAIERFYAIKDLEERLDRTASALAEAQAFAETQTLALQRLQKLDRTKPH